MGQQVLSGFKAARPAATATAAARQQHGHENYQQNNYKCVRKISGENINDENYKTKEYDYGKNDGSDDRSLFLCSLILYTTTFSTFFSAIFPSKVDSDLPDQVPDRDRVTKTGLGTQFTNIMGEKPRHEYYHQYQLNTPILPPKELGCLIAVSQLGGCSISLKVQLDTVSTQSTQPLLSLHILDCSTQLTLIFMIWHLYLSVFHNKYQSCKYAQYSREICYTACTHMNTCSFFAVCLSWSLVFYAWVRESRTSFFMS